MVFRPLVASDTGAGVGVIAGTGVDFGAGIGERAECLTSQDEAPWCFARSSSGERCRQ